MGTVDHLAVARDAAQQLQDGVLIGSELRADLLQQVQAHATLALAEAVQELADAWRPRELVLGTVETFDLGQPFPDADTEHDDPDRTGRGYL